MPQGKKNKQKRTDHESLKKKQFNFGILYRQHKVVSQIKLFINFLFTLLFLNEQRTGVFRHDQRRNSAPYSIWI